MTWSMADRADWDKATVHQRRLAVAADAELRRRHPDQHYPPLRSAEPEPATDSQREELTMTPGGQTRELGQWIKDLAAAHRSFADRLAERQSLMIPSGDPDYGDLGQAFPPWPGSGKEPILRPPKPDIRPSALVSSAPRTRRRFGGSRLTAAGSRSDGDDRDVARGRRYRFAGEPQTLDMELDGLAHGGFDLFQGVAGRDHARQVRRVGAVVGRAVALDHDRILAHDSPLPACSAWLPSSFNPACLRILSLVLG
jgi:hypothetical protein